MVRPHIRRLLVVSAALLFLPLPGAIGAVASSVTLTHTPPTQGIAGDALVLSADITSVCGTGDSCTDVALSVLYTRADGSTATQTVKGTSAASQRLNVSVPAGDVRYPELRYRLKAYRTATGVGGIGANSSGNEQNGSALAREIAAYYPAAGNAVLTVNQVLRFRMVDSTGGAVVGKPVVITPFDEPAMTNIAPLWVATTDGTGRVALTVPRTDPWIVERTNGPSKVAQLHLDMFTAWPATGSAVPTTRTGEAHVSAMILNLGNPRLAPTSSLQDQTFATYPEERLFEPPVSPMSHEDCKSGDDWEVCTATQDVPNIRTRIASNIGAGTKFSSTRFWMKLKESWTSTIGVKAGANGFWYSEGEASWTDTDELGVSGDSGAVPSGRNMAADVTSTFEHVVVRQTFRGFGYHSERLRPRDFTGMNVNEPHDAFGASMHQHGREQPTPATCDAEDFFSKVSVKVDTNASSGRRRSYDVEAGPNIGTVSLRLSMKYGNERSTEVSYTWDHPLPEPVQDHYYLYVRNGWNPQRGTADTYLITPYKAYTHWSTDPLLDVRPLGICPDQ